MQEEINIDIYPTKQTTFYLTDNSHNSEDFTNPILKNENGKFSVECPDRGISLHFTFQNEKIVCDTYFLNGSHENSHTGRVDVFQYPIKDE